MDNYRRRFQYLRLSITEACNFRCQYCLPNGYIPSRPAHAFLSLSEIAHVVSAFADLGVEKIRLTGGEPTLRRDFVAIIEQIRVDPRITTLALTTNGYRLVNEIHRWYTAGLTHLNVSIDSLSPAIFHQITGENKLHEIIAGIDTALTLGLQKVKINTVLLKGINDTLDTYLKWIKTRPLELRFIELMETGAGRSLFDRHHISGQTVVEKLYAQGWQKCQRDPKEGPAEVFFHPDFLGKIGLIMPYSSDFCKNCNRLRVSAIGKLHFCLFGDTGMPLRDLLQHSNQRVALHARIIEGLRLKPEKHYLQEHRTGLAQTLSYIGG